MLDGNFACMMSSTYFPGCSPILCNDLGATLHSSISSMNRTTDSVKCDLVTPPTDDVIANEKDNDYEYHHVAHPPVVSSLPHVLHSLHTAGKKTSRRVEIVVLSGFHSKPE